MKEFDKWWIDESLTFPQLTSGLEYACAEKAWKAALEWVASWLNDSFDDAVTKHIIDKELGNDTNR